MPLRSSRPGAVRSSARTAAALLLAVLLLGLAACKQGDVAAVSAGSAACAAPTVVTPPDAGASSWDATKAAQTPTNELPAEFGAPYRQPLASLAWEDGIYVSRDGLNLYATYIPMDLLRAVLDGVFPPDFHLYRRGPTLAGQVFRTDLSPPNPWIHADVAISRRADTSSGFQTWCLSGLNKGTGYNLGAFQGDLNGTGTGYLRAVYTDDEVDPGGPKISLVTDVGLSPAYPGLGAALPAALNVAGDEYDNPHLEVVGGTWVLFFDSQTLTGSGPGKNVFYSTSTDSGATWSTPVNVTSVNDTATTGLGGPGQQPHLYYDGSVWWLYFSAANPGDGKLGIFRAQQGTPGDWNSFGAPTLVISAGTTQGVGEASVTANGDVSFVAVTLNPSGTAVDQYDADPWYLPHN